MEILAAEQTPTSTSWYEGTADAVRKNLVHLTSQPFEYLVILSGDQLYRMDYLQMLAHHIQTEADLTVATIPVEQDSVAGLGIMQMNDAYEITRFEEKPEILSYKKALQLPKTWYERLNISSDKDLWLASMGIYIFNRKTIHELLDNAQTDFGKHIIPGAIQTHKLSSYVFQGYWEDVGTIKAFFEANLDLTSLVPKFNFFDSLLFLPALDFYPQARLMEGILRTVFSPTVVSCREPVSRIACWGSAALLGLTQTWKRL